MKIFTYSFKRLSLLFFLIITFNSQTTIAQNFEGVSIDGVFSGDFTADSFFLASSPTIPSLAYIHAEKIDANVGNGVFYFQNDGRNNFWYGNGGSTDTPSRIRITFLQADRVTPIPLNDFRFLIGDVDGTNASSPPGTIENEAVGVNCSDSVRFTATDIPTNIEIDTTPPQLLSAGTESENATTPAEAQLSVLMFEFNDIASVEFDIYANAGFTKEFDLDESEFSIGTVLYSVCTGDTDGDGVLDNVDLDDDNDGILDVDESGGNDPNGDADGDGLPNYLDVLDNSGDGVTEYNNNADGSITDYTDANSDGQPDVYEASQDGDSLPNHLDLDSDGDGIPDNVEAQTTAGYIAPDGTVDVNTGVDINYTGGLTPINTDGDAFPDYLDLDADEDTLSDTLEAGITLANNDADNDGLDDAIDQTGDYSDPNGSIDNPSTLPNSDGGEVDFRDAIDTDNDTIADNVDLDDDGDGIADLQEYAATLDPFGDEDGDGLPNVNDTFDNNGPDGDGSNTVYTDSNNDGTPDVYDFDNDSVPNHLDLDSDNDGIYDVVETGNGGLDTNNDGLISITGGAPEAADTNGNGHADGAEATVPVNTDGNTNDNADFLDIDSDDDGIPDNVEGQATANYFAPLGTDIDNDGMDDQYDVDFAGNNAFTVENTDGDALPDYLDADSDGDTISDVVEAGVGTFLTTGADVDGDGLNDGFEGAATNDGFDVNDELDNGASDTNNDDVTGTAEVDFREFLDSDGDGISDPVDEDDDNDGITDIAESGGLDPRADADNDGVPAYLDDNDTDPLVGDTNGAVEPAYDFDGDGVANHFDLDSDNDGIYDVVESGNGGLDTNNDGSISITGAAPEAADSDNNGRADGVVVSPIDTQNNGSFDFLNLDSDNDGCSDANEAYGTPTADGGDNGVFGAGTPAVNTDGTVNDPAATYPTPADSDTDTVADYRQVGGPDDDGDGIANACDPVFNDADGDGLGDAVDLDDDNDGIADDQECVAADTTLDWNTATWTGDLPTKAPSMTATTTIGTTVVTVTNNSTDNTVGSGYVALNSTFNGLEGIQLQAPINRISNGSTIRYQINLTSSVTGLNFKVVDVDNRTSGEDYIDQVRVLATNQGVPITLVKGVNYSNGNAVDDLGGGTFRGNRNVVTGRSGDVTLNFKELVDQVIIEFTNVGPDASTQATAILLTDLRWDCDTDGDGVANRFDLDSDNDGIYDVVETGNGALDTNNDGAISALEAADTNGNGQADGAEGTVPVNTDTDPYANFIDIDSDDDGIPDNVEGQSTANYFAPLGTDSDNDGMDDQYDVDFAGNNAFTVENTDGDALPDYLDADSDGDTISDVVEAGVGTFLTTGADVDGDGLNDGFEGAATNDGFDVNDELDNGASDTNNDDVTGTAEVDFREFLDSDGDGISDPVDEDDDNDGITDIAESGGLDPRADADNDGVPAYLDDNDTDPLVGDTNGAVEPAYDFDGDGVANHFDLDSDNDGIYDVVESGNGGLDTNNDGSISITGAAPEAADSDNNGRADGVVVSPIDTQNNGSFDFLNLDSDNDGCSDANEAYGTPTADGGDNGVFGAGTPAVNTDGTVNDPAATYPTPADSDTDTVADYRQVGGPDDDGDGIANACDPVFNDADGDGLGDAVDLDDDNDGIADDQECVAADTTLDWNTATWTGDPTDDPSMTATTTIGTTAVTVTNNGTDTSVGASYVALNTTFNGLEGIQLQAPINRISNGSTIRYQINLTSSVTGLNFKVVDVDNRTSGEDYIDQVRVLATNQGVPITLVKGVNYSNGNAVDDLGGGTFRGNRNVVTGRAGDVTLNFKELVDQVIIEFTNVGPDASTQATAILLTDLRWDCDTDGDGVANRFDLDSDNDGIYDVVETGNGALDANNDGSISATEDADTNGNGQADGAEGTVPVNTDTDPYANFIDIDSDDDGIPDNVEGQSTANYNAPLGTDSDNDGIDDQYDVDFAGNNAFTVENTDGEDDPDYLDLDSDNDGDGRTDTVEAGVGTFIIGADADADGLNDGFEGTNTTDGFDVNDELDNGASDTNNDDVPSTPEVDFREITDVDLVVGKVLLESGPYAETLNYTYQITLTNNGPGVATNVSITDILPDEVSYVSDNVAGAYNPVTGVWSAGTINSGTVAILEIIFSVNPGTASTLVTNTISNVSVDQNDLDITVDDLEEIFIVDGDFDEDGVSDSIDDDDDNDGILDVDEQASGVFTDTDGDGIFDTFDLDADGDGIFDIHEAGHNAVDADNDGMLDGSVGSDGVPDGVQNDPNSGAVNYQLQDTDGDGINDYLDIDDDGDGVNTFNENPNADGDNNPFTGDTLDSDGDSIPDYLDTDDDGDGVLTLTENPNSDGDGNPATGQTQDTDGDGIDDYLDVDDDGDSVYTLYELDPNGTGNGPEDTDGDGIFDYLDEDDDGDSTLTMDENPDPNGDGTPDDAVDTDRNGIPDYLDPNNVDGSAEDGIEVYAGISPNGDGMNDKLIIRGLENVENSFELFNRWGVQVYETQNYGSNDNFFVGVSNGRTTVQENEELPVGTYYYFLRYTVQSGETKTRGGYIYINR